jgi:hypothetical protein
MQICLFAEHRRLDKAVIRSCSCKLVTWQLRQIVVDEKVGDLRIPFEKSTLLQLSFQL